MFTFDTMHILYVRISNLSKYCFVSHIGFGKLRSKYDESVTRVKFL